MKKILHATLAILFLAAAAQAVDMSAALTFSCLGAADGGYREIYGSGGFMPGLRLEAIVGGDISLYASYGYFSMKGETAVLGFASRSRQHFASVGAAWRRALSPALNGFLHAGLLYVHFREEALGEELSGNAIGAEAGAGAEFHLGSRLLLVPFASYLFANDTVDGVKVKLGGFRAGVGLGVRL